MSQTIEQQINELNHKLRTLSEEQHKNQLAIQKQKQTEVEFDRIKSQNHRVFDRILGTWHNDRELGLLLLDMNQDAWQMERKLTYELEEQSEMLRKKKQNLNNQENDLYQQRQNLSEKVKS